MQYNDGTNNCFDVSSIEPVADSAHGLDQPSILSEAAAKLMDSKIERMVSEVADGTVKMFDDLPPRQRRACVAS